MSRQRDPTKHQLSARLAYNSNTPAFLQRMQKQIGRQTGRRIGSFDPNNDEDDSADEEAPQVEFEQLDADRPAIPVRPRSPKQERVAKGKQVDAGPSDDEEPEDELPQVVVLREGKHLSKEEAENEKRRGEHLLVARSLKVSG